MLNVVPELPQLPDRLEELRLNTIRRAKEQDSAREAESLRRDREAWQRLVAIAIRVIPGELLRHLEADPEDPPGDFDSDYRWEFRFEFTGYHPLAIEFTQKTASGQNCEWRPADWSETTPSVSIFDPLVLRGPYIWLVETGDHNIACPDLGAALVIARHSQTG